MECSGHAANHSVPFSIILVNHSQVTGISEDTSELSLKSRHSSSGMANLRAVEDELGGRSAGLQGGDAGL